MDLAASGVTIYSTCRSATLPKLLDIARWAEDAGCRGALVYTDSSSVPFRYRHTFCPYLVGSHDEVAHALTTYLTSGVRTFVLDIPAEPDDLHDARTAIERAITAMNGRAAAPLSSA